MIETDEQIEQTLDIAGELLEFSFGDIKGIPGHLVYNVQNFDSPFDIEKQDYSFQISYKTFIDNNIVTKDTFVYPLGTTRYTFEITSYIPDMIGWVELKVTLIDIE